MPYTPTIAVDFDMTLCDSKFPDCGPVMPGAKEALIMFKTMGFRILIWSCRTCHWHYDVFGGDPTQPTLERSQVKRMAAWLHANGLPYDEIDDGSRGKPWADYYIDDKGVRFSNNWNEILQFITRRTLNATN
jgi:hypothetical protein